MTKAFSYLRCSGLTQCGEDKDGFPRQRDSVTRFSKTNGYQIVREFTEKGVSGKKDETERPAFMEMVAAILENGVRHVLVENLSRLAREYRIQEQLLIYLATKGIQLIACDTGENVTEAMAGDPMRKAMVQIQGIFHELDRSMLVRKLQSGRKRVRDKTGRCGGAYPYGHYPAEAAPLSQMKAMREQGSTLWQIASHLNQIAAPPRRSGSRWHPGQVARILERQAL